MGTVRVYINPFDDTGNYTSYQEVTSYVLSKGLKVKQQVDNNEFNIGIFKYKNITLTLDNHDALFSDVDVLKSIFRYKRANSKVKITWEVANRHYQCGLVDTEQWPLSEEVTVFEGLLNDRGSKTEIRDQNINFAVLSFDSIFTEVEIPYSALSNGDSASDIIYECLNQTEITDLMTVSAGNITLSIDPTIDYVSDLENTTVKEALDYLLEVSNSILLIENNVIYVKSRTASSTLEHTFYGQAAFGGIEDILKISEIRSGLNKTFNFLTWEDTVLVTKDATSIERYGVIKKEIGFAGITNSTTKSNILADIKDEFKLPKRELKLTAPLSYDLLDLDFLSKVNIDYPTIFHAADDNPLPLFGVSKFGEARFPYGEWSLTISTSEYYKILGIDIDFLKEIITFTLREI